MGILKPYFNKTGLEAGCDEAGRGCLAGPVVAAAVILPKNFDASLVNDSKQLSAKARDEAAIIIKEQALAYAIAAIDHLTIDKINILKASILAMHHAVDQLKRKPKLLLIDGNRFYNYPGIPHQCIIDGDAIYASIAAASILAKTFRDEIMQGLHEEYPLYLWNKNKGYATKDHKEAINEYGITPYHRRTYAPVWENIQMRLEFEKL